VLLAVRIKFKIDNAVQMSFVTDNDGCLVDNEDLFDMAGCNEALMVLCGEEQKWSKVSELYCLCQC
jgi:hypothetical protein